MRYLEPYGTGLVAGDGQELDALEESYERTGDYGMFNTTGYQQTGCVQWSLFDACLDLYAIRRGPSKCIDTGGAHRWLAGYLCSVGFG